MGSIEFKDFGFEKAVKELLNISSDKLTVEDLSVVGGLMVTVGKVSGFTIPWIGNSIAISMVFPNISFDINELYLSILI